MWHKPCRTFHPWCLCIKTRCLSSIVTKINTMRRRRNGQNFADDIFKRIFFNENVWISIKISLKFVPKFNIPAMVQIMAWRRLGDKPLSEQFWLVYWRIYASLGLNELNEVTTNGKDGFPFIYSDINVLHSGCNRILKPAIWINTEWTFIGNDGVFGGWLNAQKACKYDVWIGLDLFNDDTRPSGHISRPTQVNVSQSCFHSLNNYSSLIIL